MDLEDKCTDMACLEVTIWEVIALVLDLALQECMGLTTICQVDLGLQWACLA